MPVHLYASAQNDNRVRHFEVDTDTGRLAHLADTEVPDGPGPLAVAPDATTLFVGHRGRASVETTGGAGIPRPEFGLSSWAVDPESGDLTQTGRVHTEGEPCFLSTDRRGRFLLSAYYQAGACAVHPLDAAGALGGDAIEWRPTNSGAHSFQVDRANRFAFVPHIAEGSGGLARLPEGRRTGINAILQFRFDQQTGQLTPNDPPRVTPEDPIGPRHYAFHPTRDLVYVNNEQGSVVTTYALDPDRGTLSPVQTVPTIPEGHDRPNAPAQIHIDPNGRYLFCSNRGHDSIAAYLIDAATGQLTPAGWTAVGERPRAFGVDPTGRFLYVTSQVAGTLAAYRIDERTTALTHLDTYEVGQVPMWVSFATLPGR